MPTPSDRHAELCNTYPAVAEVALGDAHRSTALISRNAAGEPVDVVVLTAAGVELEDEDALVVLIAARQNAQRQEGQVTDAIRARLLKMRTAGAELNVARLARETGIARSTLYSWLDTPAAAA